MSEGAKTTLRMVIIGRSWDHIEAEAAEHVARYCGGWTITAARRRIITNGRITAEPFDRRRGVGVLWRAVVEVDV